MANEAKDNESNFYPTAELGIRVSGYRCFTADAPLSFRIGSEGVAFVGANNSGKSSVLKMFVELHELFAHLSDPRNWIVGAPFPGSRALQKSHFTRGSDPARIEVELELLGADAVEVDIHDGPSGLRCSKLRFRCESPNAGWRLSGLWDPSAGRNTWLMYENQFLSAPQSVITRAETKESAMVVEARDSAGTRIASAGIRSFNAGNRLKMFDRVAYYGAFRNASAGQSGKNGSFPIGESFAKVWGEAHSGDRGSDAQKRCRKCCRQIQELFGFDSFELTAHQSKPVLSVVVDGEPYRLEELGSGVSQAVHLLGNIAIAEKPYSMVLVDEPELNLHPARQGDLVRLIRDSATAPVLFATHSLGLIRELDYPSYSLVKGPHGVECRALPVGSRRDHPQHLADIAHEMGVPLSAVSGYKSLLLVEGPEDIGTVIAWLGLLGKDRTTVVMHLGGDSMSRPEPFQELTRIGLRVYVIVDSESLNAQKAANRAAFKATLANIDDVEVLVTERPSIEHYFPQRAVSEVRIHKLARALAATEMLNKGTCHNWAKKHGSRIAKAMRRDEIEATDIGRFLLSLPS